MTIEEYDNLKKCVDKDLMYTAGYAQGRKDERTKCDRLENLIQELDSRVNELESAVAFLLSL